MTTSLIKYADGSVFCKECTRNWDASEHVNTQEPCPGEDCPSNASDQKKLRHRLTQDIFGACAALGLKATMPLFSDDWTLEIVDCNTALVEIDGDYVLFHRDTPTHEDDRGAYHEITSFCIGSEAEAQQAAVETVMEAALSSTIKTIYGTWNVSLAQLPTAYQGRTWSLAMPDARRAKS